MHQMSKILAVTALLAASFTVSAQAPSAPPAELQSFVCKDGTVVKAASTRFICRGHGGLDRGAANKDGKSKDKTSKSPKSGKAEKAMKST